MKKTKLRRWQTLLVCLFLSVFVWILPLCFSEKEGGRYALTASAYGFYNPSIEVLAYDVDMTLSENREIIVTERIEVKFLKSGLTMFYRSLPKDGAIYSEITAKCDGNAAFSYEVADNPDYSEFLDVNCIGGADRNKVWMYEISYKMYQNTGDTGDQMQIDVIGFGWPVALKNVNVRFHLPAAIENGAYGLYIGYGSTQADTNLATLSEDGKTLLISTDLDVVYIDEYNEYMAEGITLDLTLPNGTLQPYAASRLWTSEFWIAIGASILAIGAAAALFMVCKKKETLVTVVNVRAPDNMDPMKMGKWIDGIVDSEDVTSMIYYFAHKGYLMIDLEDEDDPILLKKTEKLPNEEPVYAKTLFNGLFRSGDRVTVSDLTEKYYQDVQKAQMQLPSPKMYEGKSIAGFWLGSLLGVLLVFLMPLFLSLKIGGGYVYGYGFFFAIPVAVIMLIAYIRENYRFKWKKSARIGAWIFEGVVVAIALAVFLWAFGKHVLTRETLAAVLIGGFVCVGLATCSLSRKEQYLRELGEILGFKDFIVYTEEDKLKVMLEEQPQLYYKILPYAQVLGVTKQWEEKFANILIEPPQWCVGSHSAVFDYLLLQRCMATAMSKAMRPPQTSSVGRSGGGGSFGSFGGGGFGGGGGGAR